MPEVDLKPIDEFFKAIAPFECAFVNLVFSYIAAKSGTKFEIVYGRVFLNTIASSAPNLTFQTPNLRAGRFTLAELKLDLRHFVEHLLSGKIDTPQGDLYFPVQGRCATSFTPFHPDGLINQLRYNVLTIMGAPTRPLPQPDIDWELKAAPDPYDGLQEVINEFGLAGMSKPTATVEIAAFNVAVIDAASRVSGTNADLSINIAHGLSPERAKTAYRIYAPSTPPIRGVVSGENMQWTDDGNIRRGRTNLQVPNAAVVNCAAVYNDIAQGHLWIGDPERAQNPRRAVYETVDPKLENLRAALANAAVRGQDARQLESAIAWLLWMLGFSVAHLGGTPRTRDAADLLVTTPAGHFAIVECTTGILKAENKLALLHARTEVARKSLTNSNNTAQHVLPIIVTYKTTAEVAAELEAAERLGIFVVPRETIDASIDRTLIQPNADQIYAEAEQAVSAALAKYRTDSPG